MVSSRSGLPRMWFSARAVSVNGKSRRAGGLDGRGHALGGLLAGRSRRRRRSPRSSRRRRRPRRRARSARATSCGGAPVAVLEVDGDRQVVARSSAPACSTTSSRVAAPSRRPSVKAKPELVLASALKPRPARTFAEPTSHGLGMTNGSPSCSARKSAPFWCCVGGMPHMMRAPTADAPAAPARGRGRRNVEWLVVLAAADRREVVDGGGLRTGASDRWWSTGSWPCSASRGSAGSPAPARRPAGTGGRSCRRACRRGSCPSRTGSRAPSSRSSARARWTGRTAGRSRPRASRRGALAARGSSTQLWS